MPLPWKKAKGSRISQLVAERLNSPKHGGSLVVETGFPTSLVDLFVKNRDRLKKPSSKKKRSNTNVPFSSPPLPFSSPPPPPTPPLDCSLKAVVSSWPRSELPNLDQRERFTSWVCDEIVVGDDISRVDPSGMVGCGCDTTFVEKNVEAVIPKRWVFVAVLKVFFVVVLALGNKKLAVGITLSALLLFSLEYAWMHLCRFLKPCSEAEMMLKSLIRRVMCFFSTKQDKLEEEISGVMVCRGREVSIVSDCAGLIKGHDLNNSGILWPKSRVEEIQVVQPTSCIEEEIKSVTEKFDTSDCNKKWVYEEMDSKMVVMEKVDDYGCNSGGCAKMDSKRGGMEKEEYCTSEVSEFENRKSPRAKLKSKMKKLVPRKLRCSKKKGLDLKSEVYGPEGEGKAKEQVQDKDEEQCELRYDDKLSSLSSGRYDGQEDGDAICSSAGMSQGYVQTAPVSEEVGTKARGNLGYLVLFLIVLAGLFGGRILALVLTLSWCLMLKSCETLRRCVNCKLDLKVPLFVERFFL